MLQEVFAVWNAQLNIWQVLSPFRIIKGLLCHTSRNIGISIYRFTPSSMSIQIPRFCENTDDNETRSKTAPKCLQVLIAMLYKHRLSPNPSNWNNRSQVTSINTGSQYISQGLTYLLQFVFLQIQHVFAYRKYIRLPLQIFQTEDLWLLRYNVV
jgi:hypothetical protein